VIPRGPRVPETLGAGSTRGCGCRLRCSLGGSQRGLQGHKVTSGGDKLRLLTTSVNHLGECLLYRTLPIQFSKLFVRTHVALKDFLWEGIMLSLNYLDPDSFACVIVVHNAN
jgi:hypothetical protein